MTPHSLSGAGRCSTGCSRTPPAGRYVNSPGHYEDNDAMVRGAFGQNLGRLTAIKKQYCRPDQPLPAEPQHRARPVGELPGGAQPGGPAFHGQETHSRVDRSAVVAGDQHRRRSGPARVAAHVTAAPAPRPRAAGRDATYSTRVTPAA